MCQRQHCRIDRLTLRRYSLWMEYSTTPAEQNRWNLVAVKVRKTIDFLFENATVLPDFVKIR